MMTAPPTVLRGEPSVIVTLTRPPLKVPFTDVKAGAVPPEAEVGLPPQAGNNDPNATSVAA